MKSTIFIGIMLASFILMLSAGMAQEAEENVTMPSNDSMPANATPDNSTMQDNATMPDNTTINATTTTEPSSGASSSC